MAETTGFSVNADVRFRYGTSTLKFRRVAENGNYIVEAEDGTMFDCEPDEIVPIHATSNWGIEGYDADGFLITDHP